MSPSFSYFKHGECPICNGDRKDCRQSQRTGNVHCRSTTAKPVGWGYVGEDANGFGMWAENQQQDNEAWRDRQEWRREQEQARQAQIINLLSVEERDRQYRRIARELGLGNRHRQALGDRGLTPEQIEECYRAGLAFAWQGGADLFGVTAALPGVDEKGRLRKYPAGFAVAVPDELGQIVGAQLRQDAPGADVAKYLWLSSESIGGNGIHLSNGEVPIGFYRPQSGMPQPQINVSEGFLKPNLTATLHQVICLGASGGNFASSPQQFKRYLETAATELGTKQIILNPDAGSVGNSHTMGQYRKTIALLEEWSYEVRIRWWGQVNKPLNNSAKKTLGDVDEISSEVFNAAQLLTWEEFEAIAQSFTTVESIGKLNGSKRDGEPAPIEERDRLIAKRRMAFDQLKTIWERSWKLTETDRRPLTRYDGSAVDVWTDLGLARTIGVRGGLGSGKTEAVIRASVAEAKARGVTGLVKGENALQIAVLDPTNGLCRQFEQRLTEALSDVGVKLPVVHFQDDVATARESLRDGYPGVYVMCKESFADYHMEDIDWSRVIVVIDEFSSFRQSAPNASDQMPELTRMLEECGKLIALDKFLSDVDAKVLSSYRSSNRIFFAQNEVKQVKTIHWVESLTREGLISLSHKGVALSLLAQWQIEGLPLNRVAIASDNLLELKIIEQWLMVNGIDRKCLRISSETVKDTHRFMPDPDQEIENQKVYYLLYSPTAQSGLDIQTPFDRGILICTGILPPTLMIQMLGRCRQCNEWWVSAPRFSQDSALSFKSLDADKLKRWQYQAENALLRLNAAKGDRRVQAWAFINQAMREIEKKFNSECIYDLLRDSYETIDIVQVETCQEWDKLRDIVKDADARKLLNADRIHGGELLTNKRPPSTDAEVWDIKAAELYGKYPQYVRELRQAYVDWQMDKAPAIERSIAEMGGIAAVKDAIAELMDTKLELEEVLAATTEELEVAQRIHLDPKSASRESAERLTTAKVELDAVTNLWDSYRVELDKWVSLAMDFEMGDREFVAQMRLLSSSRIERLYEGERARQNNEQDRANITHAIKNHFTSPASKRYQIYRNSEFFNRLDLAGLAQANHKDDWKTDGLWVYGDNGSDEILSRFEAFKADEELLELFPEIDCPSGFLAVVKRILKGYGYQLSGGNVRQEVEGRHKNGISRGKQRFTSTRSIYCVVFLRLECSGSRLFKQLLPALMDAICIRIAHERELFKPKKKEATSDWRERPPSILKVA